MSRGVSQGKEESQLRVWYEEACGLGRAESPGMWEPLESTLHHSLVECCSQHFFFFFWHFRPTVGIKTLGPEKSLRQENAHGGCGFPARVR